MSRIFHLLTESDTFSRHSRRPLSRWVANVLEEDRNAVVLAPSSDNSWSFDRSRIRIVDGLNTYKSFHERGGHLLPRRVGLSLLKRLLKASLHDIKAGDTVWVHDRPDFALVLAPLLQLRGARLFLHIHTAQMVQTSLPSLHAFQPDCYVFNTEAHQREALACFPTMSPTEVLSGGLDYRAFFPAVSGQASKGTTAMPEATVVFSAHLARDYDLKVFLDAMEILRLRQVPIRGSVVGGPDAIACTPQTHFRESPALTEQNVSYETYSTAAALGKKLRASKLFCVPDTWHESASLHVLEALACGLPVVTTQRGDIPDARRASPGILVVPNAAERLADVIQNLVEDDSARNKLAEEAYTTYTRSMMWSLTRDAYQSILASALPPGDRLLSLIPLANASCF